jgi:hypothetical protein
VPPPWSQSRDARPTLCELDELVQVVRVSVIRVAPEEVIAVGARLPEAAHRVVAHGHAVQALLHQELGLHQLLEGQRGAGEGLSVLRTS